jgi:hypothetical protein
VKIELRLLPAKEGLPAGREKLTGWLETGQQVLSHRLCRDGSDSYLFDLDSIYLVLVTLREFGIAPTAFCLNLERTSSKQRKATVHALNRRVAAIATALLTVNDCHQLGHLQAESDLRLVVEGLLLLLQTTQREMENVQLQQPTDEMADEPG